MRAHPPSRRRDDSATLPAPADGAPRSAAARAWLRVALSERLAVGDPGGSRVAGCLVSSAKARLHQCMGKPTRAIGFFFLGLFKLVFTGAENQRWLGVCVVAPAFIALRQLDLLDLWLTATALLTAVSGS